MSTLFRMGTRSTTKIYQDGKLLLALYKQYDGYTDAWGQDLKNFIRSGKFVNGFSRTDEKQFNGAGDFALQLIKEFKTGVGDLYATTEDDNQEYNYIIEFENTELGISWKLTCLEEPSFNEGEGGGEDE